MCEKNDKSYRKTMRVFGQLANFGFFMAASLLVGIYVGDWVDNYFNTQPLFAILGILFGVVAGFFEFFSIMKKIED